MYVNFHNMHIHIYMHCFIKLHVTSLSLDLRIELKRRVLPMTMVFMIFGITYNETPWSITASKRMVMERQRKPADV